VTTTSIEKPVKEPPMDRTCSSALQRRCRAIHLLSSTGTTGIQTKITGSPHHTIVAGLLAITSQSNRVSSIRIITPYARAHTCAPGMKHKTSGLDCVLQGQLSMQLGRWMMTHP
jgi:hypothetical protein